LISFAENQEKSKLKKLFLVHGDFDAMTNFKEILETKGYENVELPNQNQSFEL
jgi:metallo-beta-lactamase family protein